MIDVTRDERFVLRVGLRRIVLTRGEAVAVVASLTAALAEDPEAERDPVSVESDGALPLRARAWTDEENELLEALYPDPLSSVPAIARSMHRTEHGIWKQAHRLGLSRPLPPNPFAEAPAPRTPEPPIDPDWSTRDQAFLEAAMAAEKTSAYVARKLGKSPALVNAKWEATIGARS